MRICTVTLPPEPSCNLTNGTLRPSAYCSQYWLLRRPARFGLPARCVKSSPPTTYDRHRLICCPRAETGNCAFAQETHHRSAIDFAGAQDEVARFVTGGVAMLIRVRHSCQSTHFAPGSLVEKLCNPLAPTTYKIRERDQKGKKRKKTAERTEGREGSKQDRLWVLSGDE